MRKILFVLLITALLVGACAYYPLGGGYPLDGGYPYPGEDGPRLDEPDRPLVSTAVTPIWPTVAPEKETPQPKATATPGLSWCLGGHCRPLKSKR